MDTRRALLTVWRMPYTCVWSAVVLSCGCGISSCVWRALIPYIPPPPAGVGPPYALLLVWWSIYGTHLLWVVFFLCMDGQYRYGRAGGMQGTHLPSCSIALGPPYTVEGGTTPMCCMCRCIVSIYCIGCVMDVWREPLFCVVYSIYMYSLHIPYTTYPAPLHLLLVCCIHTSAGVLWSSAPTVWMVGARGVVLRSIPYTYATPYEWLVESCGVYTSPLSIHSPLHPRLHGGAGGGAETHIPVYRWYVACMCTYSLLCTP